MIYLAIVLLIMSLHKFGQIANKNTVIYTRLQINAVFDKLINRQGDLIE